MNTICHTFSHRSFQIRCLLKTSVVLSVTFTTFLALSVLSTPCVAFHIELVPAYAIATSITIILGSYLLKKMKTSKFQSPKKESSASADPKSSLKKRDTKVRLMRSHSAQGATGNRPLFQGSPTLRLQPNTLNPKSMRVRKSPQSDRVAQSLTKESLRKIIIDPHIDSSADFRQEGFAEIFSHIFIADSTCLETIKAFAIPYSLIYISDESSFRSAIRENDLKISYPKSFNRNIIWKNIQSRLTNISLHIDQSSPEKPVVIVSMDSEITGAILVNYMMKKTDLSFEECVRYLTKKSSIKLDDERSSLMGSFRAELDPNYREDHPED